MVKSTAMSGSRLDNNIVPRLAAKLIVSPVVAAAIADLSVPAPESALDVTVMVAAFAMDAVPRKRTAKIERRARLFFDTLMYWGLLLVNILAILFKLKVSA
ncbi:MAG: hypothetical protein V4858_21785 [Pseudomonadota bacterium]